MGYALKLGPGLLLAAISFGQVKVRTICASGCQYAPSQLQQAVDDAKPGDFILCDPAVPCTTTSGLRLPVKPNPKHLYITIRSAAIYNIPNSRISPNEVNAATVTYTATHGLTMYADAGASYYRFEGIRFTIAKGDMPANMIQLTTIRDGRVTDNQIALLPHDIVFDRCILTGWQGIPGPYRGILANTGRLVVTNSFIDEIKGTNSESQGIAGWNTAGPIIIKNTYIATSAIETLFGGAQPTMSGLHATNLLFQGNEYMKHWTWRFTHGTGAPSGTCMWDSAGGEWYADISQNGLAYNCGSDRTWHQTTEAEMSRALFEDSRNFASGAADPGGSCAAGKLYKNTASGTYWACANAAWIQTGLGPFAVKAFEYYWEKNHWECKNCENAVAEGNFLHNSWAPGSQSQHGACFLLNLVDNANNLTPPLGEPAATISNIVIRYNHCDQTPWGISNGILGNTYFHPVFDVRVHDNLFEHLGEDPFSENPGSRADGQWIQTGNTGRYSITYNTVVSNQAAGGVATDMNPPIQTGNQGQQITMVGNILPFFHAGFYGETGSGNLWNAIDTAWVLNHPGAFNRAFSKNVIVDSQGTNGAKANIFTKSEKPRNSGTVPCPSCVVPRYFDNGGTNDVQFVDYAHGDYHLKSESLYADSWAHGRPAGADIDQVNWSTACAQKGCLNPFFDFKVRGIVPASTSAKLFYTAYDASPCTLTVSTRPDLASPAFNSKDTRSSRDGTFNVTGLAPASTNFYRLACGVYSRSGEFVTAAQ